MLRRSLWKRCVQRSTGLEGDGAGGEANGIANGFGEAVGAEWVVVCGADAVVCLQSGWLGGLNAGKLARAAAGRRRRRRRRVDVRVRNVMT
jgi:hypothetical protein